MRSGPGIYASRKEPRLLVVDKISGGSKAETTNAGVNAATSPFLCGIDADSILERDALFRIMSRVFSDTASVVAIGDEHIYRIRQGCLLPRFLPAACDYHSATTCPQKLRSRISKSGFILN